MGWVGILGSDSGLLAATPPQSSAREAERLLGERLKSAARSEKPFGKAVERLKSYFAGQRVEFPDELDLSTATPFQRQVWRLTKLIPYGETRSYGWIAKRLGKRGAARAVGDGGLGGYSGGVGMKSSLLRLEAGHR
jgi:O6-methylguanine-DNA--protein-cysteine methyltransferase